MNGSRWFKTLISCFTVVTFLTTSVIWTPRGFAAAPEVSLPYQTKLFSGIQFSIPQELGTLQYFKPGKGPMVVHLQTAHGHYQAQKQIQALLHYLDDRYGIRTILVEGSAFKLQPRILDFFPDNPTLTQKVNDALTKAALVKGPELYLLDEIERTAPRSVLPAGRPGGRQAEAYGIEDLASYRENGVSFVDVLKEKKETEQFLASMNEGIERLSAAYLNDALRNHLKQIEGFEKNRVPFEAWLSYLKKEALKRLKLDLTQPSAQLDWPMLVRVFKIQELGMKLDRERFEDEREKFLSAIKHFMPENGKREKGHDAFSAIEELLKSDAFSRQLLDPETSMFFEDMVKALPRDFNYDAFPNVCLFIGRLLLQSELKTPELMEETQRLFAKIAEKLVQTKAEKDLVGLLKDYRLLQKLFALELTPGDYETILERGTVGGEGKDLRPSSVILRFAAIQKESASRSTLSVSRVKSVPFTHVGELDQLFAAAMKFYAGVKERDGWMERMIEKRLQETGAAKVAVITGGFHAEPFKDYFSSKDYTYALITPRLTGTDEKGHEAYVQNMFRMGERRNGNPGAFNVPRATFPEEQSAATRELEFLSDPRVLSGDVYGVNAAALRAEVRRIVSAVAGRTTALATLDHSTVATGIPGPASLETFPRSEVRSPVRAVLQSYFFTLSSEKKIGESIRLAELWPDTDDMVLLISLYRGKSGKLVLDCWASTPANKGGHTDSVDWELDGPEGEILASFQRFQEPAVQRQIREAVERDLRGSDFYVENERYNTKLTLWVERLLRGEIGSPLAVPGPVVAASLARPGMGTESSRSEVRKGLPFFLPSLKLIERRLARDPRTYATEANFEPFRQVLERHQPLGRFIERAIWDIYFIWAGVELTGLAVQLFRNLSEAEESTLGIKIIYAGIAGAALTTLIGIIIKGAVTSGDDSHFLNVGYEIQAAREKKSLRALLLFGKANPAFFSGDYRSYAYEYMSSPFPKVREIAFEILNHINHWGFPEDIYGELSQQIRSFGPVAPGDSEAVVELLSQVYHRYQTNETPAAIVTFIKNRFLFIKSQKETRWTSGRSTGGARSETRFTHQEEALFRRAVKALKATWLDSFFTDEIATPRRVAAVRDLGTMIDKVMVADTLRGLLREEKNGTVWLAMASVLWDSGDPWVREQAIGALRDDSPEVRQAAAELFGEKHEATAVPLLTDALRDNSEKVRGTAAQALEWITGTAPVTRPRSEVRKTPPSGPLDGNLSGMIGEVQGFLAGGHFSFRSEMRANGANGGNEEDEKERTRKAREVLRKKLEPVYKAWGFIEGPGDSLQTRTLKKAMRLYIEGMTWQHTAPERASGGVAGGTDPNGPFAPIRVRAEEGGGPLDRITDTGNAVPTSQLADRVLREAGAFQISDFEHGPQREEFLAAAAKADIIWNTLCGGIGESLPRQLWLLNKALRHRLRKILSLKPADKNYARYEPALSKLKDAEERGETDDILQALRELESLTGKEPLQVKPGAKGTDLGRMEKVRTKDGVEREYFISDAEARFLFLADPKIRSQFGRIAIQPIVNYESRASYVNLLKKPYLGDILTGRGKIRTYEQALKDNQVEIPEMLDSPDLPKFAIPSNKNVGFPTAERGKDKGQTGGHGQPGIYFMVDFTENAPPHDGASDHLRVFTNGDNRKARPNPFLVGAVIVKKIPILKIVTPARPLDKKGGKEVLRIIRMPDHSVKRVFDQWEEIDARAAMGQSMLFYAAGQPGGFGKPGKQLFNENSFYFNMDMLHPILEAMSKIVGQDEFLDGIMPFLFDKRAKGKILEDNQLYVSMDSAIGYVVHKINTFYMIDPRFEALRKQYGPQLLYYLNDSNRNEFGPKKGPADQYLHEGTDYSAPFDVTVWDSPDAAQNLIPPEFDFTDPVLGADGQPSSTRFWMEAQSWLDSLGFSRVRRLKSFKAVGRFTLHNGEYIGDVVIINRFGRSMNEPNKPAKRVVLSSGEYLERLQALGCWDWQHGHLKLENVQITISEDGTLLVEKIGDVRTREGGLKADSAARAAGIFHQLRNQQGVNINDVVGLEIRNGGELTVTLDPANPGLGTALHIGNHVVIDGVQVNLYLGLNSRLDIESRTEFGGLFGLKLDLRIDAGAHLFVDPGVLQEVIHKLREKSPDPRGEVLFDYTQHVNHEQLAKAFYIRRIVESVISSSKQDPALAKREPVLIRNAQWISERMDSVDEDAQNQSRSELRGRPARDPEATVGIPENAIVRSELGLQALTDATDVPLLNPAFQDRVPSGPRPIALFQRRILAGLVPNPREREQLLAVFPSQTLYEIYRASRLESMAPMNSGERQQPLYVGRIMESLISGARQELQLPEQREPVLIGNVPWVKEGVGIVRPAREQLIRSERGLRPTRNQPWIFPFRVIKILENAIAENEREIETLRRYVSNPEAKEASLLNLTYQRRAEVAQKAILFFQKQLLTMVVPSPREREQLLAVAPLQTLYEVYRAAQAVLPSEQGIQPQEMLRFFYGIPSREQGTVMGIYRNFLSAKQGTVFALNTARGETSLKPLVTLQSAREVFLYFYGQQFLFLTQMVPQLKRETVLQMFYAQPRQSPREQAQVPNVARVEPLSQRMENGLPEKTQLLFLTVFLRNLLATGNTVASFSREALMAEAQALLTVHESSFVERRGGIPRSEVRRSEIGFRVTPAQSVAAGQEGLFEVSLYSKNGIPVGNFSVAIPQVAGEKTYRITLPETGKGPKEAQFTVTVDELGILRSVGNVQVGLLRQAVTRPSLQTPSVAAAISANGNEGGFESLQGPFGAFLVSKIGQRWGPGIFFTGAPFVEKQARVRAGLIGEREEEPLEHKPVIRWSPNELENLSPEAVQALQYWTRVLYTRRPVAVALAMELRGGFREQQISYQLPVAAHLLKALALERTSEQINSLTAENFSEVVATLQSAVAEGRLLLSAGQASRSPELYEQLEVLASSPELLKIALNKLKETYESEARAEVRQVPSPEVTVSTLRQTVSLGRPGGVPSATLASFVTPDWILLIKHFYFGLLPMQLRETVEAAGGREALVEALRKFAAVPSGFAAGLEETGVLDQLFSPEEALTIAETLGRGLAAAKASTPEVLNFRGEVFLGSDVLARFMAENPRALFYLLKAYAVFSDQNQPPVLVTVGSPALISQIRLALDNQNAGLKGLELAERDVLLKALEAGKVLKVIDAPQGISEIQVINGEAVIARGGIASLHLSREMLSGLQGGVHFAFGENIGARDLMLASVLAIMLKTVADLIHNVSDPSIRAELLSKFIKESLPGVHPQGQGSSFFVVDQITRLALEFIARAYVAKMA